MRLSCHSKVPHHGRAKTKPETDYVQNSLEPNNFVCYQPRKTSDCCFEHALSPGMSKPPAVSLPQHGLPTGQVPGGCPCTSVGHSWATVFFFLDCHRAVHVLLSHWRALQSPCCTNPVGSAHCTTHSPFLRNSISSPPEDSERQ